jgi:hypothetical protein
MRTGISKVIFSIRMTLICHSYRMPRKKNIVTTRAVTVALTPQVYEALNRLTETGFSGKNVAETAAEMIRRGLESVSEGDNVLAVALRSKASP